MRKLTVLLILLLFSIVVIVAGTSKKTTNAAKTITTKATEQRLTSGTVDPPRTIDGTKNPELIPDIAAYSVILRLLSNRQTEDEKNRARSYLRYAGLKEADIEAFLIVATTFQERVAVLDSQVKSVKDRNWPSPSAEVMAQLTQLQQQKEVIIAETVASLPNRLSASGLESMRRHVNERVKGNMKVFTKPTTPPNGHDWQSRHRLG